MCVRVFCCVSCALKCSFVFTSKQPKENESGILEKQYTCKRQHIKRLKANFITRHLGIKKKKHNAY